MYFIGLDFIVTFKFCIDDILFLKASVKLSPNVVSSGNFLNCTVILEINMKN